MAMTDPVGDLLTRIRNGQSARLQSGTVPASRMRSNVLDVLQREGYIRGWFEEELRPGVKGLRVEVKDDNGGPGIKGGKRGPTRGGGARPRGGGGPPVGAKRRQRAPGQQGDEARLHAGPPGLFQDSRAAAPFQ